MKKYSWHTHPEVRRAVQCIVKGDSFHKASKKTGVSPGTIKKFYLMYVNNPQNLKGVNEKHEPNARYKEEITVFTPKQEITLMQCYKHFEYLFYGISMKECRMLAYQMVISEDMKIPVGWRHGMASIAWLISFQLRHSDFMNNLEKPNRCWPRYSIQRTRVEDRNIIEGKKIVTTFYDDLEAFIQKTPKLKDNKRVFSLDEAYTSINPEIQIVDRESKSDLLTTCCFICADGTSLPPVVIKPYLLFNVCFDIPSGAVALTGSRGQMTPDLFTEVMQHFVKHSHSSVTNPSILIIDTDLCHLSYTALNIAKGSGVHVLTLHPHVSGLLQPLHGEIFSLFYKTYYDAMEAWWQLEEYNELACDLGKFVSEAYSKAMTPENIQNAFKNCGISPFDRDLFTDADYLSCIGDQGDQSCIECRLRYDRSKKPCLKKSDDDNDDADDKAGEEQVEESEHLVGDEGESSQTQGNKLGDQEARSDCVKMLPRTQSGQELDKLKRRLIRSVARLIKEKKTEDEVWAELKKECGKNCKTLWVRMRSLTLKKLKRLLDANDRSDVVPSVARMTLTDWLLYDLVLVHEKLDVINRSSNRDSKVLNNLFSLVQRFQIEGRSGDDLAEAWTAATVSYNSKGHQCSPMLMQRRWYQIKELTRHKLYQFWFNYRGNERLLLSAKQDPPTPLQRAISLRYPDIITQQFPTWEERVEQKLVIMPEEFEVKMRKKDLMKPSDEAIPDVLIVEQKIDTITVDSDSDFNDDENEDSALLDPEDTENDEMSQTPIIVQVKTEPQDPYENIDITEHPVYPEKSQDRFQDAIEKLKIEEDRLAMSHNAADETSQVDDCMMPLITNVTGAVDETITTQDISENYMEIDVENPIEIVNTEQEKNILNDIDRATRIEKELNSVVNDFDDNTQESIVIDDDDDVTKPSADVTQNRSNTPPINEIKSNVIDITSPEAKKNREDDDGMASTAHNSQTVSITNAGKPTDNNEVCPIITAMASESPTKSKIEMNTGIENKENVNEETSDLQDTEDLMEDIIKLRPEKESNIESGNEVMIETNYADDGFEFADDGIEYNEEHNDQIGLTETSEKEDIADAGIPKFDLKLLMNPVVYTTKLDEMKVYKGRSLFDTIDEKQLVDKIMSESKPVSAKSINVEQIKSDNQNIEEANEIVKVKVEDAHEFEDDLFQNESSNESDSENSEMLPYDDSKRVKLSSSLLQKPRSRSYNPIQLCKNPDFNTRLKRLTVGFFSSERNRVFLKACKPMTIDLSKAFESKLINGTIYLKPSDSIVNKEVEDVSESAASITPSAVAVQSLMDTVDVDKILQTELRKRMMERNKTINLPNISVVRQINQQLLMAEVAPIRTQVYKPTRQVLNNLWKNHLSSLENRISTDTQAKEMNETPTDPVIELSHVKEITNQSSTNLVNQTAPVINNEKCTVINITAPPLPIMVNDKSKEDKILEKQRKKYEKLNVRMPLWSTKMTNYDLSPCSESLLTIDTLYKVLNALDPTSVDYRPKSKTNQNKIIHPRPGRPVGSRPQCLNEQKTSNSDNQKEQPPTNLPITDPPTINQPKPNPPTKNRPTTKKVKALPKKQRSCCWARTRISKMNGLSNVRENKHKCPVANCRCCCREILRQTEINHEIELLEQMQNHDKFDETIEQVVQQSRDSSNKVIPAVAQVNYPFKKLYAQKKQPHSVTDMVMSTVAHLRKPSPNLPNALTKTQRKRIMVNVGTQADDENDDDTVSITNEDNTEPQENIGTMISVPESQIEVTIDLDDDHENVSGIQTPKPKIRVHAAQNESAVKKAQASNSTPLPMVPAAPQPPTVMPLSLIPRTRVRAKIVAAKATPTVSKVSSEESDEILALPCSCRPNVVVDKQSSMLLVDGSNECPRHTKSRISKETRIYLNRKHMSAAARPFYVGKNKILLTNISPRNAQPPPPPAPPLELPEGVQVVLLSDGTISYVVDPGVELTLKQINAMPNILAAVQNQIKASGITLPDNHQPTQDSDINNANEEVLSTKPDLVQECNELSNSDSAQADLPKEAQQEPLNEEANVNVQGDLSKEAQQEPSKEAANVNVQSDLPKEGQQKPSTEAANVSVLSDLPKEAQQEPSAEAASVSVQADLPKKAQQEPSAEPANVSVQADLLKEVQQEPSNEPANVSVQADLTKEAQQEPSNEAANVSIQEDLPKEAQQELSNEAANLSVQEDLPKEAQQEPLNEAANVLENRNESQESSVMDSRDTEVNNDTEEEKNYLLKDTSDDKETTATDVAEAESLVFSKPAVNTDNSGGGTEHNALVSDPLQTVSSSRNLLSDLMEMSGILEEDVTPVQQQPSTTNTAPEFIQPLAIDTSQDSSDSFSAPPLSPSQISAQINEKTYNLNPVTSFAELKYACDNNGLFFKLDLNNGLIVPINVCIQKTPESSSVKNLTPSEVIDLTDEQTLTVDEEADPQFDHQPLTRPQPLSTRVYKRNKSEMMTQKIKPRDISMMQPRPRGRPRKFTKSILIEKQFEVEEEVPSASLSSKEDKKQALMKRLSNNLKPLKILPTNKRSIVKILKKSSPLPNTSILKRISNIKNQVEAKIDLVDSDAPMEEEYLLEDFSDDSDDEPLAKIAKKMRSDNSDEKTNNQESQGEAMEEDNVDFEVAIDAISAVEPPTILNSLLRAREAMSGPVPTQLVVSGSALDQPLPTMMNNSLSFVENESDDEGSEDDCILGV